MFAWRSAWPRIEATLKGSAVARYAAATFLILLTVFLRAVFDPVFSPGVYYHLYYPAVIVAAYLLGAGPAMFAVALACAFSFAMFEPTPSLDWKPHLAFLSFVISSIVAVVVLSHMRARMTDLSREYERIDALTQAQADLFREHAERVSNHLQLTSALLQATASDLDKPALSRALEDAASRTLLISRLHRSFARGESECVAFQAFAERLVQAALDACDRPPLVVAIEGRLTLPLEQATSLGLVLLECINARAKARVRSTLRVQLSERDGEGVFKLAEENIDADNASAHDTRLLGAISEQMRGRLVIGAEGARSALTLVFPMEMEPLV